MGIVDRVERGLERAIKAPFARVFKAEVQPVEIASAMRGAMDERAAVLGPGRTMVPNVFTIELAKSDYERLSSYDTALTDELVAAAEDHADAQRYTPAGSVEVRLSSDEELETGIFRVRPASKNARRQARRQQSPQPGPGPRQPGPRQPGPPPGAGPRHPSAPPPGSHQAGPPQAGRGPQGQGRPPEYAGSPAGADPNAIFRPGGDASRAPQPAPPGAQDGPGGRQGAPGAPAGPPRPSGGPVQAPPGVGGAAAVAARRPGSAGYQADGPGPGGPGPSTREFPASSGRSQRPVSARTGGQPWLDINGRHHVLGSAVTVLGRDSSADIVVEDPGVSRRHIEVRLTYDGPRQQTLIRDLGSTNGTYVNGDRIGSETLTEGDRITIGSSTLVFHAEGGR